MISAIACGYSVIATILTIPVPESPSWLMMKGRTEESKHALRFFRALKEDGKYPLVFNEGFLNIPFVTIWNYWKFYP